MLLHPQQDIEITGRTALRAGLALSAQAQSRTAVNAGRDVDLQFALGLRLAAAVTFRTGAVDDLPRARAGRADRRACRLKI